MKKVLIIVCLLSGLLLVGMLSGYHFKEIGAIRGDVKKIQSYDIDDYGKAVLFEDKTHHSFGVASLEKKFGFLYRYDGGSFGYSIEEGKPFQATGIGDEHAFLVAVKTAENSNIEYIVIGNHMENVTPSTTYELSIDDIKKNPDSYNIKTVKDHYVLFVLDNYTEDTWTIRAFDKAGNLIADKLFGGDIRYIDWE
ncbi:hypothetical protein [Neobacillus sp. D3-1R]|uniref:hypothetical protein n=1 Tax=Neobacillus sp. D3-1R TaxID=3445778 RepID=UPI003FA1350C